MRNAIALLVASGASACTSPAVTTPGEARVCAVSEVGGASGGAGSLAVAPAGSGAVLAWTPAGGGPVTAMLVDRDGIPTSAADVAWAGTYTSVTATTIDDRVVLGAVADHTSFVVTALFGQPPYRELGLLGGITGAAPMVAVADRRYAASVGWGGLLVNPFDAQWGIHTSNFAVLTPNATEVAAAASSDAAVFVWPTPGACYVERMYASDRSVGAVFAIECASPRLVIAAGDATLAFEHDGGIYVAHGAVHALDINTAERVADGSAPRLVRSGTATWLAYRDPTGALVLGTLAAPRPLVLPAADAHELAILGDLPHLVAVRGDALELDALCAD